ncbi:MAG: indolepyruvate ferredoxin oxidoreductase subunit alpha [Terrisporobacter othiniensis]|uniref:indolepyruvate ferredoxin oxidoreductase subunit alpha n=1 Tax=Terrisporobacter othiniensis TaxID=1577792 RepID=UPI002904DD5D|nr:indolepyruvate ferredoxin oxidoreductase subunit alpha [Terrisporobacter othiniensis]MDU2200871.1 indolepyruvate ferredoxin oxidoreductase subunit alpha [Terrisporobacter othiniensis]
MKKLMTGNEAVARGAYEAGVKFASAYPGTPSTEILENIALYKEDIKAEWAPNEKVAVESAAGASIAGARTVASMKHVGLNVAADPLFTIAYTGVNGGFVIITADEPGQHSSQNEQDNRNYAKSAKIPMLEPSDSQEAKDMIKKAFEISEKYDTPVLYRLTTRLCHSKSIVECNERKEVGIKEYVKDANKYVTVPAVSRKLRVKVEERLKKLTDYSNTTEFNYMEINNSKVGVIVSGMCFNFAKEVFKENVSYLKLGFTFPMPDEKIKEFSSEVDKIYIIEENDGFIEEHVKSLSIECYGKNTFPPYGEMTPDIIREAVTGKTFEHLDINEELLIPRPPTFCPGCPHRGLFYELGKRKDVVVTGDIGCYTLGFSAPYNSMDCCVCMGASLGSGHGAQQVFNMVEGNKKRVVGVLGDSTFFHTGINGLFDVIYNKGNSISIILDNRITGMTGHQQNPGSGYTLQGEKTTEISIEEIVKACKVKNVRVINPNKLSEVNDALDWALSNKEASVIITRWPCALKKFSPQDIEEFNNPFKDRCTIVEDLCIGCKKCTKTGCPAISYNKENKKAITDKNQCLGCEVCAQVCPKEAIIKEVK